MFGILWAITRLATSSFDTLTTSFLIGGAVLVAAFAVIEHRRAEPMLNLALLRVPSVTPTLLASLFQGLANFCVLFLVIMYLQGLGASRPIDASLLLVPGYVVGSAVGPLAGRVADRFGPVAARHRRPLPPGRGAPGLFTPVGRTGLWVVVLASVLNGVGASGFFPANTAALMRAVKPQVFGVASGMLRTFANIGMVFSFSMAISGRLPFHLAGAGIRHIRGHGQDKGSPRSGVYRGSAHRLLHVHGRHGPGCSLLGHQGGAAPLAAGAAAGGGRRAQAG